MDVKEAISKAKEYVKTVYEGERIRNVGLEEINWDEVARVWDITIGFSRPWEADRGSRITGMEPDILKRSYKIVRIRDDDGVVASVRHRDVHGAI